MQTPSYTIKVAILDMYACTTNQGMRGIRKSLQDFSEKHAISLQIAEFEVRLSHQLPGLDYDIYISSGGPGSPLESENTDWEQSYFNWLNSVIDYNNDPLHDRKKKVFFICHSFQMACRYFKLAQVVKRKSQAFGVFPVHFLPASKEEVIFKGLPDPFYAVDSRDFQVVQPDLSRMNIMGATILAIEKSRPHVPLERAIMAIRFNEHMIGTQFHPEADAIGMIEYLNTDEKKAIVLENHGIEKWQSMIDQLGDPDKIEKTFATILPQFLTASIVRETV